MLQNLVILEAGTRYYSVKLSRKLAWLRFYDEVKLNKSTLVLNLVLNCPAYMSDLFKFIANLHRKTGRYSKLNLACPRFNRETEGGRTFLWNQLPINLRQQLLLSERPFTDFSYRAMMK